MAAGEVLSVDQRTAHQARVHQVCEHELLCRSVETQRQVVNTLRGVNDGGGLLDAESASPDTAVLTVSDPATGQSVVELPAHPDASLEQVVGAAAELFAVWDGQPQPQVIRDAAAAVESHAELLADVITVESGKTVAEARGEVKYALSFLRWFAARASEPAGASYVMSATKQRCSVSYRGVGPVVIVTPWNFPLAMITRKVAAAWAAGCPVVAKPAEATPLTALVFAQICRDAGLPEAAFQAVVSADPGPTVAALLADRRVRKVSFTGSTRVGQIIAATAATNIQRVSLELGGNAAFVVCADADLETAVRAMRVAKFRNAGQTCIAANRFLVHASHCDAFIAALQQTVDRQVVGSGFDRRTTLGPMISDVQKQRAVKLVQDAEAGGASVYRSGDESDGAYFRPVVVTEVSPESALWREEVFAPVATVMPFESDDQALALANDTDYGLANYVMTESVTRRARYVDQLHSGMVGVNTGAISDAAAPFGGVGLSGYGREGGAEGLAEYQDIRYVADVT